MRKLAFVFAILFVVCGCGNSQKLQEQQTEYKVWKQDFAQKLQAVDAMSNVVKDDLQDSLKYPANPEAYNKQVDRYNQHVNKYNQLVQSIKAPVELHAVSQDDQSLLKDAYDQLHKKLLIVESGLDEARPERPVDRNAFVLGNRTPDWGPAPEAKFISRGNAGFAWRYYNESEGLARAITADLKGVESHLKLSPQ